MQVGYLRGECHHSTVQQQVDGEKLQHAPPNGQQCTGFSHNRHDYSSVKACHIKPYQSQQRGMSDGARQRERQQAGEAIVDG